MSRITKAIEAAIITSTRHMPEAARCEAVLSAIEVIEHTWTQRAAMAADNQIEAARKEKHD